MPGHSTTDCLLTTDHSSVCLLVEKVHEYRRGRDLCIAFIDLKSAFDSVDSDAIWLVLRSISVPEKTIRLLQLLLSNSQSCVRFNGEDTPCPTGHQVAGPLLPRLLTQRRLCWLGHILRMPDDNPTRTIFQFDPTTDG